MIDWHVAFFWEVGSLICKSLLFFLESYFARKRSNVTLWCCCFVLNFTCAPGCCVQVLLAGGNSLHNYAILSMAFATLMLYWSKPLCLWCQLAGTCLPGWVPSSGECLCNHLSFSWLSGISIDGNNEYLVSAKFLHILSHLILTITLYRVGAVSCFTDVGIEAHTNLVWHSFSLSPGLSTFSLCITNKPVQIKSYF